jgi:hypothetical protein
MWPGILDGGRRRRSMDDAGRWSCQMLRKELSKGKTHSIVPTLILYI